MTGVEAFIIGSGIAGQMAAARALASEQEPHRETATT